MPKKTTWKIMQLNVQYPRNKLNLLQVFVDEKSTNLLIITEHALRDNEIEYYKLDDCVLADSYCRKQHRGGGVAIFVKEHLPFKKISFVEQYCKEETIEMAGVVVHTNTHSSGLSKHNVIGTYCPPNTDVLYYLDTLNRAIRQTGPTDLSIVGDSLL
ncbi:uncharacterized protein LOC124596128 [Schistocerca americana]|uniref:uncharacterized protein LOC124596128 n=1 Tax=Schistocerca americana TaxID=7009 RepID=UPI001F4FA513|nr:uncharacterized protein LOC124596128 [Schistocerca americana]